MQMEDIQGELQGHNNNEEAQVNAWINNAWDPWPEPMDEVAENDWP